MSAPIITVENLSKKYFLRHAASGARYTALRDVITSRFMQLFRRRKAQQAHGTYEEFWALDGVSFEAKQGEVLGIIGRNGAGKSTLLKILSRITEPTKGKVTLRGRVASLLEVGTGFHPELTGRENIYLNGAILGMTRAEIRSKFDAIVAFAEVERFLDTQVKHYSSGMYVRLAFAVAAHLDPEILIIDEVLAVGDLAFQKKCLSQIHNVARDGRTVLLVSHQLDVVKRLATKAALFENGQLKLIDNVDLVLDTYLNQVPAHNATYSKSGRPHISSISIDPDKLLLGHLVVDVGFTSPEPISMPTVGIVFSSLGGSPVFGSNTLMHPSSSQAAATLAGTVRFFLPNAPLLSGEFSISAWLSDRENNLDHLPHAISFAFQDPSPTPYFADPRVQGPCKISPTWSFVTDAACE